MVLPILIIAVLLGMAIWIRYAKKRLIGKITLSPSSRVNHSTLILYKVLDGTQIPRKGVVVNFLLSKSKGAQFSNGKKTVSSKTDANGVAMARIVPVTNGLGRLSISMTHNGKTIFDKVVHRFVTSIC